MKNARERSQRNTTRQARWLEVTLLLALAGLTVLSFANQRRIDRIEDQLTSRLNQLDLRLATVAGPPPSPPAAGPTRAAASRASDAAEPDPGPPPLVGVKPAGSKMPDADRRYRFDLTHAPARGPADAPVTIVEFSDFACSFCRKSLPTLARIEEVYGDRVRLVWKHLPLSIHRDAPLAHLASVAAADQGRFWEFADRLFADPGRLGPDDLRQDALALDLDMQRFEQDLNAPETRRVVEADMREAVAIDLTAAPGFFVNGRYLRGAKPFEDFAALINQELDRLGLPVPTGARGSRATD